MRRHKWLMLIIIFILLSPLPASASIIRKPPVKISELTYKDLPCSDEQRIYIHELISTMGEQGKLSLLFKQSHLRGIGERINDVHPLKFLGIIFTQPYLKSCMAVIWNDYFKRNGFLEGLVPALNREMDTGKLMGFLPDFSSDVGVSQDHLQGYFNDRDWENFVLFLIQS